MFPPPQPWKQLRPTEAEREYLAFSSRFAMRSWLRVPAFFLAGQKIEHQLASTPGVIGYSLGAHLPGLMFYTLSVWEDEAALREFTRRLHHGDAMRAFHKDMRMPSPFIRWSVRGSDVPLKWSESLERMRAHDAKAVPIAVRNQ